MLDKMYMPTMTDRRSCSARDPTGNNQKCDEAANNASNACFQGGNGVRLDDLPCWFCFHHDNFSENLPLTSFRSWLRADFQPAKARNRKNTGLLHLSGAHTCKAAKQVRAHCLL